KAGEHWIEIQKNTFMNWVNLQLQASGMVVTDFETDFDNGVKLCALVEALQNKKIGRVIKNPLNQHQSLENVTLALRAIAEDNVRLVNIGSEDIVNGSLKLILGLIWHLILRYQIGKTKFPPKKLMLEWLQAVLPECQISNFTSDWNDGVALHALIDYCKPGLSPNWRQLPRHDRLGNCTEAMQIAKSELNIPIVVRPEDFSSPHLDDLSGMTYLSYYMKVDSPGYFATRRETNNLLQNRNIDNFQTDWNSGHLLCDLVKSVGGDVPGWPHLTSDHVTNLQTGIDAARKLGVEPIFSAKEMADPEVEHLGIMAYAAKFRHLKPVKISQNRASMDGNFSDVYVKQEKHFVIHAEDGTSHDSIRAEVIGPDSIVPVRTKWSGNRCDCYFTPTETGQHKLNVYCNGDNIPGCPVPFKVHADRSKVKSVYLERAVVGVNNELKVDTSAAGQGDVRIEATSPSGRVLNLPVMYKGGVYTSNFAPNEVGDWLVSMVYDGDHVNGSPYVVKVFDPSLVKITDLSGGKVGHELTFHADATAAGEGEVTCKVIHGHSQVPCYLTKDDHGKYTVDFTPQGSGTYTVHAYMNNIEVRGSPYTVDIIDSSRVTVTGEGLNLVPVNTPAVFTIHTNGAGGGKVDVNIVAPSGKHVQHKLRKTGDQTYEVEYLLEESGEYTIEVKFAEQEISGSPFVTKAFDMRKLVVSDMPSKGTRDHPVQFSLDASKAGPGNIEIRVNEGRVPCDVKNRGNHVFTASFLPENSRPHTVEIAFNESPVIGSPWKILIVDPKAASLKGKDRVQCHEKTSVYIQANGQTMSEDDLDVIIKGPDGDSVPYKQTTDSTGDTVVKYTPTKIGEYTIYVKYCDHHVNGSPFTAKAYNIGAISVSPLDDGFVNQPMHFTIDVGDAGEGQLQIMVNKGNIPNEVEPEMVGKYLIKFIPTEPGEQVVEILFNDHHLKCSPLTCIAHDLNASIVGLHQLIPVQQPSSFHIQSQANISSLPTEVIITGPNGMPIPSRITLHPDGKSLNVEYMPRDIGIHTVKATLAGLPIKGSPFGVRTFDPNKVKITRVKQGTVGVPCKFNVDASEAGDGTLEITINHNGQNIPNNAVTVGKNKYECSFIAHHEGSYKVNVLYNDMHVQGSPYSVNVIDVGGIRITGDQWNAVSCNKKAGFNVVSPHGSFEEMSVRIIAPDGSNAPCRLSDRGDGTCKIDWHPTVIGAHKVYIDYAGVPIQGSPFTIRVFDASRVRVSNIAPGLVNRPLSFNLDASEAGDGNLEILVMCEDEIVPNYVQEEGNTKFKVTFTPKRAGLHLIHTQFNGEAVKGSPHQCPILDPESVQVTGSGVTMAAANFPTSFHVNMRHAGDARLNVRVLSPYGEEIPVHISGNTKTGLRIDYTPQEVGLYKVYVECAGSPVRGSPFTCNVFDPALIRVNAPGRAYFGRPMHFNVDTSAAGQGKLNFLVKCRGNEIPCRLREVGQDRFDVSFTPQNIAPHLVTLFFNDLQVPGTPFEVAVIDGTSVNLSGDGLRSAKVFKESGLTLEHQGLDERDMDVQIIAPSGNTVPARLINHGSNLRMNFTPLEVGPHKIHVNVGDSPINGSPFTCNVYDPSAVRIIDVDKTPQKEREIGFTIDTSSAGAGNLDVQITHKGQPVHAECHQIDDGQFNYTFKPLSVGRYEVKATFNGDTIPGSPLIIEVEEDRPTFIRINFSSVEPINTKGRNWFVLHTSGHKVDKDMLDVMILAPNGENIPARLIQQPDGDYKVEWTPTRPGRHSVDVLYGGQQIQGSPFHIDVFDIHKIRVNNFHHGNINETAGFKLDCTQAGQGKVEVRIQSPSGRTLPYNMDELAPLEHSVSYTPTEAGQHKIFISYSGMELNGSPFHQEISEGTLPPAHGEGLHRGEEDKPATFVIDARNLKGEPSVQVDGPNAIAKCSIDPLPDGQYKVTYIPVEVGLFDVYVRWNGKEIPGSPFHPKVVDARKVKVVGGWHHYMDGQQRISLVVGEEKQIPFDTSEAGPGQMRAEVKSPSALMPVEVDDEHKGKSIVKFVPREEGTHYIHLYWSDHPLVNSPYQGFAVNGAADPSKVWLTGRGLKEAIVREEAEFVIDGSQAGPGEPDVELTGVRAEIQVFKTPLGGGKFRCTYIPVIPGAYLLNISWNGRQLRGAPYKVNVIGASYPNRVVVNGEGLKGGLLGSNLDFRIDTRRAGPGELTAYCMGPTKVAYCELSDHHDGTYRLVVQPQEAGKHVLQIKYGGEHVQGSPFPFKVSAQPDASKVRVSGPGVEHGILANFQSQFIVETRGAGAGQLTVRIRGPKGAFQVEMYRESQKDRTILCRYYPSVIGLYIINVRWSGVDVPGSPFHVNIMDTQQDLEQVLHESFSDRSHHIHPNNSFHNSSINSSSQLRYPIQQNSQHHNMSRSSGYYHYREEM
ncbi:filamin-B-like, partial [Physella acuta]|uniref:filamin-B-like n=1 Tax=Physella acuta TaxID=109671 RepID=UPI0027DCEA42